MVATHLMAMLIATVISSIPVEIANALAHLKKPIFALHVPETIALIESQWGTPYVKLQGRANDDGTILFVVEDVFHSDGSIGGVPGQPGISKEPQVAPPAGAQEKPGPEEPGKKPASQDGCTVFQTGADIFASEAFQTITQVTDAEACREACNNTMKCRVALFDEESSTCELMKKLQQPRSGQTTALVLPNCDAACFSSGQKLNGDGTPLGSVASAMICQALCEGDPACKGFTWLASTLACISHSSAADLTPDADAVSGPRESCAPKTKGPDYAGACTQEHLSATEVGHVTYMKQDTWEQCHLKCLEAENCAWFTYNSETLYCYLKVGRGVVQFVREADLTSPKLCDSSCFQKNIELDGTPITTVEDSTNPHHCRYDCYMSADCQFWSWNGQSKQCALYGITAGLMGHLADGFWSGSRGGCGAESQYLGAPDQVGLGIVKYADMKTDYYATFSSVETLEKCLALCEDELRCLIFQYNAEEQTCLLAELTGVVEASSKKSYVGRKSSSTSCYRTDYAFAGDAVPQFELSTATAAFCQAECDQDNACKAFVWSSADQRCIFKGAGAESSGEAKEGFVSGPSEPCYTKPWVDRGYDYYAPSDPDGGCNHRGVESGASPLRTLQTETSSPCLNECSAEYPRCETYVWNSDTRQCNLYAGLGKGLVTGKTNSYLGPTYCNSRCFYKDYEYAGEPMDASFDQAIETPHECQMECRSLGECYAWTYSTEARSCRFFDSVNSLVLRPAAKVWSGRWGLCQNPVSQDGDTKDCINSEVTISSNTNLATIDNIRGLGECMGKCRLDARCIGATFNENTKKCYLKWESTGITQRGFDFGDRTATRECRRDCYIDDVKYAEGSLVKSVELPSAPYCQAQCVSEKDKCAGWSYQRETGVCELWASDALAGNVRRKDNGGEGWISGHSHFCF